MNHRRNGESPWKLGMTVETVNYHGNELNSAISTSCGEYNIILPLAGNNQLDES